MLGFFGFSFAALVLVLYSLSAKKLAGKSKDFKIEPYYLAYLVVAAAMVVWAVGTQLSEDGLRNAVVVGDILLFISTILLAQVVSPKKYLTLITAVLLVASIIGTIYRANNVDSVMKDGVLIFYTPRVFGAFLIAAFLLIWFRANTSFYKLIVSKKPGTDILESSYFSTNMISLIGVCGFLFAHKSITIASSFTILIFSFLIQMLMNMNLNEFAVKEMTHARRK